MKHNSDSFTNQLRQRILSQDPRVERLLQVLNTSREESRIIGGAIRNAYLNKPISDIDIATTMLPLDVVNIVKKAGFKAVPTGLAHGTITVVVEGRGFEVTTLRQDIETNGRHAVVAFARDFAIDAQRRDFTVNALSMGLIGDIYDYTDGIADLNKGIIRFIGDPVQRIQEDYLRILRFFRFSAYYAAAKLDETGLQACLLHCEGISSLSRERIGHEMRKWLVAPRAVATFDEIKSTGLIKLITTTETKLDAFSHLVNAELQLQIQPCIIRRLYSLSVNTFQDLDALRHSLKLSNAESDQLHVINTILAEFPVINEGYFKQILYKHGIDRFMDWLLIAGVSNKPLIQTGIEFALKWVAPKNPFSGKYFMELGLKPSQKLGKTLKLAEDAWIETGFSSDLTTIESIASKAVEGAEKL